MAQDTHIKVGGSWVAIDNASIKVGGSWTQVDKIYAKIAGVWEQVWANLTVTCGPITVNNARIGAPCTALARIDTDGDVYESNSVGVFSSTQTWLTSGSSSAVWVERDAVSGTALDNDDFGGTGNRVQLSSSVTFGYQNKTSASCTFTVSFYDASVGGTLLDTAAVTLSASQI